MKPSWRLIAAARAGVKPPPTGDRHQLAGPVPSARPLKPIRSWAVLTGALLVAVATTVAVWWLLTSVPAPGQDVELARLRIEAIRTGLSVGAGVAAALALALAFRRQQVAERTQMATEYDAGEKRLTELYVKAADQLGSDKAPVRLAGLYALERLAQDNPPHRQSIVDVVCAYLRMPYDPPDGPPTQASRSDHEERQVRIAAQRILVRHFTHSHEGKPNPAFWSGLDVDLTEATLLDLDLSECRLMAATFTRANFYGTTSLFATVFEGRARFDSACFHGLCVLGSANFLRSADFRQVTFYDIARLHRVRFKSAFFTEATFQRSGEFVAATFGGPAVFDVATFHGEATFQNARFRGGSFQRTTFLGPYTMSGARTEGGRSFRSLPPGWHVDGPSGNLVETPRTEARN